MKNQTIDIINNRRTIRAYDPRPLTRDEINTIIHGAMRAPTAGNMMLYTILEVSDQKKKERLAITCDHQPHIAKAPLVLIFLADMQRWYDYFNYCKVPELCEKLKIDFDAPAESDLLLASCDALIAAQNAVITAESMGIGSCYIGDIIENIEIHREMFDLPRWVFPITMLCFGYPKGGGEKVPLKSRYPQEFIHFSNKYHRLTDREFDTMYQNDMRGITMEHAENMGQEMYLRKLATDFWKEMQRSVKVAIKDWIAKKE